MLRSKMAMPQKLNVRDIRDNNLKQELKKRENVQNKQMN